MFCVLRMGFNHTQGQAPIGRLRQGDGMCFWLDVSGESVYLFCLCFACSVVAG